METRQELIRFIRGLSDEELRNLSEVLSGEYKRRRAQATARVMGEISVGDLVHIKDTCRPTYLRGAAARVINVRQTKIEVELVHGPVGKFRSGRVVVPASLLNLTARGQVVRGEIEEA